MKTFNSLSTNDGSILGKNIQAKVENKISGKHLILTRSEFMMKNIVFCDNK